MDIEQIKKIKSLLEYQNNSYKEILNEYRSYKNNHYEKREIIETYFNTLDVNYYQKKISENNKQIENIIKYLKKICKHNIIFDQIDLDYGEKQQDICYCEYCELNF